MICETLQDCSCVAVKGKGPGKESRDAVHTSAGRPAAGLPRSLTSFSLEGQLQQTACVGSCPPLWTPSERELCSQGPCPGLSSFSLKGKLSYSSGGHPIPHSASCPDSPTPISGFLLCPPDGPGVQVECPPHHQTSHFVAINPQAVSGPHLCRG